ncbi:DedA family protein [Apibacter sp. B3706]|uniref:DedA family protein n=1 Tax=unclassified Apibacter TaxID=2630820 RepID=UPI00135D533E|nr:MULTISPECIES: VTT domain-containing protein [unclassified Apibacter]MXP05277.1 DedA family protein [Apibacter sp. B3546]MXP11676.1 DedA family protein [Apibacter sp. B3239]QII69593.1 DedA family protein [Apibacter sp. B3706]
MNDFSWGQLVNPEFYIKLGGIYLVLFIVFAETGLFAGFFLPGDSLLFLSGIYSKELIREIFYIESDFLSVFLLSCLISIAGIIGNEIGYWFGKKSGSYLYNKKDTFLFKKKYLFQAKEFYEKHGGRAIILARFLPILRTFAPIIAGIVQMNKGKYLLYNVLGSTAWSFSLLFSGHYLYQIFLKEFNFDLKRHIETIVLVMVIVTTAPVVVKLFFQKNNDISEN